MIDATQSRRSPSSASALARIGLRALAILSVFLCGRGALEAVSPRPDLYGLGQVAILTALGAVAVVACELNRRRIAQGDTPARAADAVGAVLGAYVVLALLQVAPPFLLVGIAPERSSASPQPLRLVCAPALAVLLAVGALGLYRGFAVAPRPVGARVLLGGLAFGAAVTAAGALAAVALAPSSREAVEVAPFIPMFALLAWRIGEQAAGWEADLAAVMRGLSACIAAAAGVGVAGGYLDMFLKPSDVGALNQFAGLLIAPVVLPLIVLTLTAAWRLTDPDDPPLAALWPPFAR